MNRLTVKRFYLEEKGAKRCLNGSEVMDTDKCKEACTILEVRHSKSFKEGKPCLKAYNGACKQSRNIGLRASLVCEVLGKITYCITSIDNSELESICARKRLNMNSLIFRILYKSTYCNYRFCCNRR